MSTVDRRHLVGGTGLKDRLRGSISLLRARSTGSKFSGSSVAANCRIVYILCSLSLGVLLGAVIPTCAQNQNISQMVHTAWTGRDGAPQGITGLAQTSDGTLWIGSVGGLYSFDGVAFAPFAAKPGSPELGAKTIESLFVSRAGDLWVFGYRGAPSRIHDGFVTSFDRTDGDPIATLEFPQQDSRGTTWAVVNGRQLVALGDDSVWHKVSGPAEDPGEISALFIDSSDALWIIQNDVLYRQSPGTVDFRATRVRAHGPAQMSESLDHSLWISGLLNQLPRRRMRVPAMQHVNRSGDLLPTVLPTREVNSFLIAVDGSMWISEQGGILEKILLSPLPPDKTDSDRRSDTYVVNNGPTIASRSLLHDADGNVWVGGLEGLDRFKRSVLVPAVPEAKAGVWFSCVDGRDNVWLGNPTTPLRMLSKGRVSVIHATKGVDDLHCGRTEGVYFSEIDRLSSVVAGTSHHLPKVPSEGGYAGPHYVLGFSALDDHLLIAVVRGAKGTALWTYRGGIWRPFRPAGPLTEVTGMSPRIDGSLYLAHPGGSIDRFGEKPLRLLRTFTSDLGTISGFSETSHGLLAYGSDGVGFVEEGSVRHLRFLHPEDCVAITGAAEAGNGELWLNGHHGIVRVTSSEVQAALTDTNHRVASANVHEADFTGPSLPAYNNATISSDSQGTLWISTLHGVVHVDPAHISPPAHPPQLSIRSLRGDDRPLDTTSTFPSGTHTINVQYFGLDLTSPQTVTYQYKLDGYDAAWQNVGHQTAATYTHLRPGRYTFQVEASNGLTWSLPVASEAFTILPHFYQTTWFTVLCITSFALLSWGFLTLRIRSVANAVKMRAEERAEERMRIARDLHDTLLQGVQGLQLNFHVAAQGVPLDAPYKQGLDRVLALADRLILEGRTRVLQLRSEPATHQELIQALEQTVVDLSHTAANVKCRLTYNGSKHQLRPHVSSEIYLIARESLTNGFQHAAASEISLELEYGDLQFMMSCRDNGDGFVVRGKGHSVREGQWGYVACGNERPE